MSLLLDDDDDDDDDDAAGDLSSSSHEVPHVPEGHTSSGKGPVRKNPSGVGLPVTSRTRAEMGLSETVTRL